MADSAKSAGGIATPARRIFWATSWHAWMSFASASASASCTVTTDSVDVLSESLGTGALRLDLCGAW